MSKLSNVEITPIAGLDQFEKDLADLLGSQIQDAPYIIVTPSSASTSGGAGYAHVRVGLLIEIVNSTTGKKLWIGEVQTSTRTGKGFIAERLLPAQLYDQTYTLEIFKLLTGAWRKAGLL